MIRLEGMSRNYGPVKAVQDLNLQVSQGEVYGLVGPNGAGKSTVIKILAGLLRPSAGRAQVGGVDLAAQPCQARRILGYMPDFFGVYDSLRVDEYLDFFAAVYGIDAAARPRIIAELLELVDLAHKKNDYVDLLSRGMKQRLGLARCLVHDPLVLLLDEPASGLDPRARVEMRELVKRLGGTGKTILISSHILPEIASICTEVGIMDAGRLAAGGKVEQIGAWARGERRLLIKVLAQAKQARELLAANPGVSEVELQGREIKARFTGEDEDLSGILKGLVAAGVPVVYFGSEAGSLEEVFMRVTEVAQ